MLRSCEKLIEKIEKMNAFRQNIEQKWLRGKIGRVLWISLMTRLDLAFDVNKIDSKCHVPHATVQTVKYMNTVLKKAKNRSEALKLKKLGDLFFSGIKMLDIFMEPIQF